MCRWTLAFVLFVSASALSFGQNLMEIYQNTGTKLSLPVEAIDSVRFLNEPLPQRMLIYLNDQRIFSIRTGSIDSIAYALPPVQVLPEVLTLSLTASGSNGMVAQGSVQSEGSTAVTRRGFCWSQQPLPSIVNNQVEAGSGTGSFSDTIGPLEPGKSYFVRAYASNAAGTAYGEEFSISTENPQAGNAPGVNTLAVEYFFDSTARSGGNISTAGSFPVKARGLCWASGTTPTLNHSFSINGAGTGSFNHNMEPLMPETVYRVRAWALSEAGVSYGQEREFTTGSLPLLQTISAGSVRPFTAIAGGRILSNGSGTILKKGICWSSDPYPVVEENPHTHFHGSDLSFAAMISGLQPGAPVYYRSYAKSSIGLSYGPLKLVTGAAQTGLSLIDIDGNVYQADTIGSQIWMTENLRVSRYRNGDTLLHSLSEEQWNNASYLYGDEGAWCYYQHDASKNLTYGKLYNYEAVRDFRNLCPAGWDVPVYEDWNTLADFARGPEGLMPIAPGLMESGLFLNGTGLWYDYVQPFPWTISNSTGFSALPGGYKEGNYGSSNPMGSSVEFTSEYTHGRWWEAGGSPSSRYLTTDFDGLNYGILGRKSSDRAMGLSVRCLKKLPAGTVTSLLCDSAQFTGTLMHKVPAKNFRAVLPYTGGNGGPYQGNMGSNPVSSTGVTGLKAFLEAGFFAAGNGLLRFTITGKPDTSGIAEFIVFAGGQVCTLRCAVQPIPEGFMADQDGNLYPTITIGNQVWMKTNLTTTTYRDGTPIPRPGDGWGVPNEGAYCVNNELSGNGQLVGNLVNDSLYGKLYNWYAVQDNRKLCPAGWRMPSRSDFLTLMEMAGGPDTANGRLKSTGNIADGTGLWQPPNADASDALGFSALPGGYRLSNAAYNFSQPGSEAKFWTSSTSVNTNFANSVTLFFLPQQLSGSGSDPKGYGLSVRCIKE